MGLAQRCMECVHSMLGDVNLSNNLGFSLYTVLYICHMVATSDE